MARILIGWELGANTGHIVKLIDIADELVARGHQPVLAVQQIGAAPSSREVWQAPLWPAQLATLARMGGETPATMGDILAVLGLDDVGAMRAMLSSWDRIVAAVGPDAIAAEFAPALMMAARGRVPLLALGSGFSLPPPHLPMFASLTGRPATRDEGELLDRLNAALRATDRPQLGRLPEIFVADRELVAAFREFDPYREWRRSAHGAPSARLQGAVAGEAGEELFVYVNGLATWPNAFWQGLADSGLKVRIHNPRLSAADARALEGAGMIVERGTIPFERIVSRSRLILSHGGLGLASSALLAGMPVAFVPFDIEKRMVAASMVELNLGVRLDIELVEPTRLAAMLRSAFNDHALHDRAREAAVGFQARMTRSCAEESADALEALLA